VEPRSKFAYPITLISKVTKPVVGKIIFASIKDEGTTAAQVLVFDLESHVMGRIPKEPVFEFEG